VLIEQLPLQHSPGWLLQNWPVDRHGIQTAGGLLRLQNLPAGQLALLVQPQNPSLRQMWPVLKVVQSTQTEPLWPHAVAEFVTQVLLLLQQDPVAQRHPDEQSDVWQMLSVVVVVDELEVDVLVVVGSAETHGVVVDANELAGAHPWPPHATPAGQHVSDEPLPQCVIPAGHEHRPLTWSTQATPLLQQDGPHGVVPDGQQHDSEELEHADPSPQHPAPQARVPDGHVAAPPRKGLSRAAPAAAATPAPITFSAPRRDVGAARRLAIASKSSAMAQFYTRSATGWQQRRPTPSAPR
jgi:hypothetical protein